MADTGFDFSLEVLGEAQIRRHLSRFGDSVKDYTPAWTSIVQKLRAVTKEQFATEGRGAWPALSPAYAAWKNEHYPGKTILRRTDAMYNSLVGQTGDSIITLTPLQLRWGTSLGYAAKHQKGVGVPKRRVIALSEEDKRAIIKIVQAFVVEANRKAESES